MARPQIGVGFIGVGNISEIYLTNLTHVFKEVKVVGLYDIAKEKAESAAKSFGVPKVYGTLEELLLDPEVEIVLNLTRPGEHYRINKAALLAGKHVYTEKPLAATYEEGKELVELAKEKGLLLGGAPDTFLGAGIQTCRKIIDSGFIGTPIGGAARIMLRGHEVWHPDPEFFYKPGAGPMMDMGPYYITAFVNLLGGVKNVTGVATVTYPKRTISSEPKFGSVIDVEVPTNVAGIMEFKNGAVATIQTTFDVCYKEYAMLEIYGSEGTLICPDPNMFTGEIKVFHRESDDYANMPITFKYYENSRGLGLADMAKSVAEMKAGRGNRPFRANGDQMLHVLEIMTAFEKSSKSGRRVKLESKYNRSAPMVYSDLDGVLD